MSHSLQLHVTVNTIIKLLQRGALSEHSMVTGEEMLPDLPSDDTNWTCMNRELQLRNISSNYDVHTHA